MATRVLGPSRLSLFSRYRATETAGHSIGSDPADGMRRRTSHGLQQVRRPSESNSMQTRLLFSSSTRKQSAEKPGASTDGASAGNMAASSSADLHSEWRRRRVVSSFLCHGTPHTADFRVSIFKRSHQVRTYPGKWAACSGSVEPTDVSPVRAALRELREETGLRDTELVRLGGGGGPRNAWGEEMFGAVGAGGVRFDLHDAHLCVVWEVWPFLWRVVAARGHEGGGGELSIVETQAKIQLDWEHDEMRFASLDEIKSLDTVEDLGRGVRVVLASLQQA